MPVLVPCVDASQQAAFVARRVLELREEGIALNDMAVLYRSHFHALELQLELTRRNIPYGITSGMRFYEQAHIKDVAAYLRLVCNPRDELAFKRLTKLLPGIGGKRADKLWTVFDAERTTRSAESESKSAIAETLHTCASSVPKKAASAWVQFAATIAQLEDESVRGSPSKMIRLVFEAVYEDYLRDHYTHYRSRQEDLEQLAGFSRQFSSSFLKLTSGHSTGADTQDTIVGDYLTA